jgi:hypothetical protein
MSSFGNFSAVVNTTINNHVKGATPAILRKRYVLAKMMAMKRIKLNCGGKAIDWTIRHKRTPLATIGEGGTVVFTKESKYKKATPKASGNADTAPVQDTSTGGFLEAIEKRFGG